jgi:hypothetical protein
MTNAEKLKDVKLCPYRVHTEDVKSTLINSGNFTMQRFYPCLEEICMAYVDGKCMR